MQEFKGMFEELQALLADRGCVGQSSDVANGRQFRSDGGGILNWYSATGRVNFQGPAGPKGPLIEMIGGQPAPAARTVADVPAVAAAKAKSKVFVVHGHESSPASSLNWCSTNSVWTLMSWRTPGAAVSPSSKRLKTTSAGRLMRRSLASSL